MKNAIFLSAALVLCAGLAPASNPLITNNVQDVIDAKNAAITHSTLTPGLPVGGENIASATPIPALPFLDTGDTGLYLNDYDEACPFTGSTAPDVVYSFTPTADISVNINLCGEGTQYDTKVYVYENTVGNVVGCNDDFCSNSWTPYASAIECLPMLAGNTYYIVVDGYGTASGPYELSVAECIPPEPCDPTCPPNAMLEGEADCADDQDDFYNAGCNGTPNTFTDLPCDADPKVVCGTSGNYLFGGVEYRDTDWYRISWPGGTLRASVCAAFPPALAILDAVCPVVSDYCFQTGVANEEVVCEVPLSPGNYYIFVSTVDFVGTACGSPYTLTVNGCPGTATEGTSWGDVKDLFR